MRRVDPERSTLNHWEPGRDSRHAVAANGGPIAYTVASRDGVRLHVPKELLGDHAGTWTRDQYDLWEEAS